MGVICAWVWDWQKQGSSSSLVAIPCFLTSVSFVCRRWVLLVRKGKGTTWTSGQFSVGDQCGNARRPSASVTRPLRRCSPWQGSSTDDRSTVRGKFTPCPALASTACGRPWRASSWSPARARRAAGTTVTHTQSSELFLSPSVSSHLPLCLPLYSYLCL